MSLATTGFVRRALERACGPEHPRRLDAPLAARGMTYDYLFVGGKKLTPPAKTSNFLKVYLNGTTACEWVAAMPETQASDSEVFDVSKVRIHLPGNFAG